MQLDISSILTIIFVIAKIFGYLSWSWLWVLSPLWITLAILLVLMTVEVFM